MSTYIIGDVHGDFQGLQALVRALDFSPSRDRLVFVGDLINRGPESLDCLRWVRKHEDSTVALLGNHEVYLLAAWAGRPDLKVGKREKALLREFLAQADGRALLESLRRWPLVHWDEALGLLVVHGGLPPFWNRNEVLQAARGTEAWMRSADWVLLADAVMEGGQEVQPPAELYRQDGSRLTLDGARYVLQFLTQVRYCNTQGSFVIGGDDEGGGRFQPWFHFAQAAYRDDALRTLAFGHWSRLGGVFEPPVYGLDQGRKQLLTALEAETGRIITSPAVFTFGGG